MVHWFEQAMRANGDSAVACWSMLDCLDPKWHGTVEQMLAFARACRETGNWRSGITLLSPNAHFRYSTMVDSMERTQYLGSPEVWTEIQSVYDESLEHYPKNNIVRSKYAALAALAGRYSVAHEQFEILGPNLTMWTDSPYIPFAEMERLRDETAQVMKSSGQ